MVQVPEARHTIATWARRFSQSNSLPEIQRLSLIDWQGREDQLNELEYDTFNDRDVVLNLTYKQPHQNVCYGSQGWMLRSRNGEEVFGALHEIETIAEGTPWLETSNQSRFPAAVASTSNAIDAGYEWSSPPVDDRPAYRARSEYSARVWSQEERSGMKLLNVLVTEGLTAMTPMLQIDTSQTL